MHSIKLSRNGFRLDAELKDVPVSFVNGLRRILLAEIPTVVINEVQILDNTTKMIHEMLRHRMEMLPVNVRPEETEVVRDSKLELLIRPPAPDMKRTHPLDITTDDFNVLGPRKNILLNDRDEGTPVYFMTLAPHESVHIKASLRIETKGASQVCVATYRNHVDPDLAKLDKDSYVALAGDNEQLRAERAKIFDNYEIQRSFVRDKNNRPVWFDFTLESIGVVPAKDLVKQAATIYKAKIEEWCKNPIIREEDGYYSVETEEAGHTIGALAQALIYESALVDYVSYRIVHPLLPNMIVRFSSKVEPEKVIERFRAEAVALCESILKSV
jgi:DNA-directed RNA polymerase subunit L